MKRYYCDICGEDITPGLFNSCKVNWESRKYLWGYLNDGADEMHAIALCPKCDGAMFYLLENREALSEKVASLSLRNRLRLLFKLRMKEEEST